MSQFYQYLENYDEFGERRSILPEPSDASVAVIHADQHEAAKYGYDRKTIQQTLDAIEQEDAPTTKEELEEQQRRDMEELEEIAAEKSRTLKDCVEFLAKLAWAVPEHQLTLLESDEGLELINRCKHIRSACEETGYVFYAVSKWRDQPGLKRPYIPARYRILPG